ncbi:MAG: PEP-CTERM sorting domain-containing protein, partial [Thermoguttaceae bacterium]
SAAMAAIVGPYTADANTIHLWHLDESTVPTPDAANYYYSTDITNAKIVLNRLSGTTNYTGGTGGSVQAQLGVTSYSGFGTCLDTSDTNGVEPSDFAWGSIPSLGSVENSLNVQKTFSNPTTNAYTMEAIVKVGWDCTGNWAANLDIMSAHTWSPPEVFRFEVWGKGSNNGILKNRLVFHDLKNGAYLSYDLNDASIDPNNPEIEQGKWYHVAVTCTGEAAFNNWKLYWTDMDSGATEAHMVAQGTSYYPLAKVADGGVTAFRIGNCFRSGGSGNVYPWIGLVDEARISDVARGADEMMFTVVPEPATVLLMLIGCLGMGLIWRRK